MLVPFAEAFRTPLQIPGTQDVSFLLEPAVGSVIPDVLIALWGGERNSSFRRRLPLLEYHILAMVEQAGGISADEVRRHMHLPIAKVEAAFSKLERWDLVRAADHHWVELTVNARTDTVELIAVEVKMRRWQEALKQAESYLKFADRSYVLLDGNQVRPCRNLFQTFARTRVGLLLQHGFLTRELHPAGSERPISPYRTFALQKLFAA